ncbi:hypothetical protein [Enterococcus faecium]|uniref:hypothetical protein n=1 Tax=Enterococcus faecium TaxID=1352 RepID=UPI0021FE3C43|nr:hypothetical protein [Enterococcus faecium]BDP47282.1 hypothetical protein EfmJHP9_21520 [Enterococcus faecium]
MDIKWLVQQNDSNLELAIKYLEETIFEDEHLTDNFLQVLKYLEIYSVKKNKLIGDKNVRNK